MGLRGIDEKQADRLGRGICGARRAPAMAHDECAELEPARCRVRRVHELAADASAHALRPLRSLQYLL